MAEKNRKMIKEQDDKALAEQKKNIKELEIRVD